MKLSIILPTYNEAGNIGNLIKTIAKQSDLKSFRLEFIVVDDNSPDGTALEVKKLLKQYPIKLFVRTKQKGLATAVLHGIKHAHGDMIVLMDTDFNHQPKDIYQLLIPLINHQADLVIGSRYVKGGGMHITEAGTIQFFGSKWGNYLVNRILLNLPVNESLSGFVAFKKNILTLLNLQTIFRGYGEYCICLLYQVHKKGFRLTEVPVIYGKRQSGQSKSNLLTMCLDYFKTAISLKFNSLLHPSLKP